MTTTVIHLRRCVFNVDTLKAIIDLMGDPTRVTVGDHRTMWNCLSCHNNGWTQRDGKVVARLSERFIDEMNLEEYVNEDPERDREWI